MPTGLKAAAFILALPAMFTPAHAQDDTGGEPSYVEEWSVGWTDEDTVGLLTITSLGVTILNLADVWDGRGHTGAGILAMALGGASMAFGFHEDRSLVTAAGTMAFVTGLANLAISMTRDAPSRAAVSARPFVATIGDETHAGLVACIRY